MVDLGGRLGCINLWKNIVALFSGGKEMNWARILFFKRGILSIELFLFLFLMIVPSVKAEIVKGKVFSVQVNGAELDVGSAHGLGLDDIGRIYYSIMIDGKETPIYVGKFKVMEVFEKSSRVQIV